MLSRTAIRFFSVQKRTTGLVGVQVLENPRESLIDIYQKTLDTIKDSGIPTSAQYYKDVEALTTYRKNIVEKETDVSKIEDVIGGGQVEELYRMAEDELKLIPKYAEWRMWETRDEHEAREQSENV